MTSSGGVEVHRYCGAAQVQRPHAVCRRKAVASLLSRSPRVRLASWLVGGLSQLSGKGRYIDGLAPRSGHTSAGCLAGVTIIESGCASGEIRRGPRPMRRPAGDAATGHAAWPASDTASGQLASAMRFRFLSGPAPTPSSGCRATRMPSGAYPGYRTGSWPMAGETECDANSA